MAHATNVTGDTPLDSPSSSSVLSPSPPVPCSERYQKQCGGRKYRGPTCCPDGQICIAQNPYYSQCRSVPPSPPSRPPLPPLPMAPDWVYAVAGCFGFAILLSLGFLAWRLYQYLLRRRATARSQRAQALLLSRVPDDSDSQMFEQAKFVRHLGRGTFGVVSLVRIQLGTAVDSEGVFAVQKSISLTESPSGHVADFDKLHEEVPSLPLLVSLSDSLRICIEPSLLSLVLIMDAF